MTTTSKASTSSKSRRTSAQSPHFAATTHTTSVENSEQERREKALVQVFTIAGFDSCFLNSAESPKRPHFKVSDNQSPMVLHIDDDIDLVDALTVRLRAAGMRVGCALDGQSGIQAALNEPASAIILDYDMPNDRGDVILDLLKKNERTQNIPVVVLTAIHKRGLKKEMLSRGASAFMTKPFEFEELLGVVNSLVEPKSQDNSH